MLFIKNNDSNGSWTGILPCASIRMDKYFLMNLCDGFFSGQILIPLHHDPSIVAFQQLESLKKL